VGQDLVSMSFCVDFGKERLCYSTLKVRSSLVNKDDHALCPSNPVLLKAYLLAAGSEVIKEK